MERFSVQRMTALSPAAMWQSWMLSSSTCGTSSLQQHSSLRQLAAGVERSEDAAQFEGGDCNTVHPLGYLLLHGSVSAMA